MQNTVALTENQTKANLTQNIPNNHNKRNSSATAKNALLLTLRHTLEVYHTLYT